MDNANLATVICPNCDTRFLRPAVQNTLETDTFSGAYFFLHNPCCPVCGRNPFEPPIRNEIRITCSDCDRSFDMHERTDAWVGKLPPFFPCCGRRVDGKTAPDIVAPADQFDCVGCSLPMSNKYWNYCPRCGTAIPPAPRDEHRIGRDHPAYVEPVFLTPSCLSIDNFVVSVDGDLADKVGMNLRFDGDKVLVDILPIKERS